MPIFDYQCQACGHTFDVLQKPDEGALRKCPECGKARLKKLLAAPNFHLKGSGWYKTDFRDKAGGKSADKAAGGESRAESKAEKKGHNLDQPTEHKHDSSCGHTHTHGGSTHSHGPGGHKH
jgi:putative FmdB family regulatory protein